MSENSEILADLNAVGGIIARAESDLLQGELLDLSPLEEHIETLCTRIENLPPGEGHPLQAKLLALADSFGRLSRSIEAKMNDVKSEIGDVSGRQQAANAYANSSEPGK